MSAAKYDQRQSSYLIAQMSVVYALLLDRLGARTIYPLYLVFPE